jgi:hypothetical protein
LGGFQPAATPTTPQTAPRPSAPPSPQTREQVKEELTQPAANASERQIRALKDVLKELKAKDESKQEMIAKIAVETKGFTVISKTDCEQLILRVSAMLEQDSAS